MPFTLLSASSISGGVGDSLRPNAKPLIINGDMAVAQRGTSASSITDTGYRTCDRWEVAIGTLGTWTISQDTDVPSGYGFANSLKLDCTTADASPAASDNISIKQKLEGQDVQVLKKGTANAEKVTIAFWIKATKTGTNILEIHDRDNTRLIGKSYTVDTTDTWEQKVIVIDADTTGALGDDNGNSWEMNWWLGAGTTFTSGTLQTTWGGQTNANRAVGQVNHGDSTSNNVWITGVQLEVGEYTSSTLPSFQHEDFGDNLARCQRYFFKRGNISRLGYGAVGAHTSSAAYGAQVYFPTIMRATPSQSHENTNTFYFTGSGQNQLLAGGGTLANEGISKYGSSVGGTASGTLTVGNAYWFNTADTDAYIQWDAEL